MDCSKIYEMNNRHPKCWWHKADCTQVINMRPRAETESFDTYNNVTPSKIVEKIKKASKTEISIFLTGSEQFVDDQRKKPTCF